MKVISEVTKGKSYRTYRYVYDAADYVTFAYDDHQEITWESYGETEPLINEFKNMKSVADKIQNNTSLFRYFLDGSRHTYKVDDIAYKNSVYPVIAGQIGISCCERIDKKMSVYDYERYLVITLPKIASSDDWNRKVFFIDLCNKINESERIKKLGVKFDEVIPYSTKKDEFEKIENKGIAVIQSAMIQREVAMVSRLVSEHKISNNSYLLKDGSLEYNVDHLKNDREKRIFQSNFTNVVGVSKSFNPQNCLDKNKKNNSNVIAELPLYNRTPVCMYTSPRLEGMKYAIWFLRIRDKKYTISPFDGILKIEKILITNTTSENKLDTEEVDLISANIINERNPVCYGVDKRWANHLYPIYITEKYAKSKYLSDTFMLNIF